MASVPEERNSGNPFRFPRGIELYLIGALLFLGSIYGLRMMLLVRPDLILPLAMGLIALVVASFGGTRVCLPIYLATTVGEGIPLPGAPVSLNQCCAAILFLGFIFDLARRRVIVEHRLAQWALFAFAIYFSTAAVILKPPQTEYPIQPLFYLLVTVMITCHYWERKWLNALMWGILAVGLATLVAPALAEYATGQELTVRGFVGKVRRINGLAKDSVLFASTAVWTLLFAILLFVQSRDLFIRMFLGICTVLLIVVAFLTVNRQTPIVLFISLVAFMVFLRHPRKYLFAGALALSLLALIPLVYEKLLSRFEKGHSILTDFSLVERHDKLEMTIHLIKQHPWFGVGFGVFKDIWSDNLPPGKLYYFVEYPHKVKLNIDFGYMQILTEYGIVGSALVLLFLGGSAALFWRYYRLSLTLSDAWHSNFLAMIAALYIQLLVMLFIRDAFLAPQMCVFVGAFFAACTAIKLELQSQAAADAPASSA